MPGSWRITVEAPDKDAATAFKDRFFKQLLEERGSTLVFELPEDQEPAADELKKAAETEGLKAEKEAYSDPLEDAEPVDFW